MKTVLSVLRLENRTDKNTSVMKKWLMRTQTSFLILENRADEHTTAFFLWQQTHTQRSQPLTTLNILYADCSSGVAAWPGNWRSWVPASVMASIAAVSLSSLWYSWLPFLTTGNATKGMSLNSTRIPAATKPWYTCETSQEWVTYI